MILRLVVPRTSRQCTPLTWFGGGDNHGGHQGRDRLDRNRGPLRRLSYRVAFAYRGPESRGRCGFRAWTQAGLDAIDELATEPTLASYSYLSSSRAEFLRQLERRGEATLAFEEALTFCDNAVERSFLLARLKETSKSSQGPRLR